MMYSRYSPPNLCGTSSYPFPSIFPRKIGACASRLIPGPISGPGYKANVYTDLSYSFELGSGWTSCCVQFDKQRLVCDNNYVHPHNCVSHRSVNLLVTCPCISVLPFCNLNSWVLRCVERFTFLLSYVALVKLCTSESSDIVSCNL